ncbi:MAG: serine/threonine-protein phosphatase [Labilithrix sp.]|nr:serine/threonine-protein phosphatase [Labilithrix sp.]MBX3223229.1 serine/threonine-protein phosphatase [Labilithrix sp.]
MPSESHYLSVAAVTHLGRVREKNEDAFVVADLTGGALLEERSHARFDVGERGLLLAVSDGMGGAQAGEVASALVVETITREIAEAPLETPRDAALIEAVQRAHDAVRVHGERVQARMGATLTAVFVRAGRAYIAEVGDSRAYLLRGGEIAQVTHDQSMVQLLVDSGIMKPEDARESPMRNVILQAMGHQPDIKVALGRMELRDRDCLILCSDGLTGHVSDVEIKDIVLETKRPELAAARLVDLANGRGGKDNITVIVAGVGGALAPPAADERPEDAIEVIRAYEPRPPRSR